MLIEDNSHGHGGLVNKRLLGTRGNFGFSSPRKVFKIYSGGVLYSQKKFSIKLAKYKYGLKSILIRKINDFFLTKIFIKKYFSFKKDYSNPFMKRDNIIYNKNIDNFALYHLLKFPLKLEPYQDLYAIQLQYH